MDIPRKPKKLRRILFRIAIITIILTVIAMLSLYLSRLEQAVPVVERQTLLIDSVKRGDINMEVRGVGTLVSEDMLIVPAQVGGRTIQVLVEPGTAVEPNTIIFELSNPELELNWFNAKSQLNSAKARLNAQKASLDDQQLGMQASLAQTQANLNEAKLRFKVDKKQYSDGLISELQMTLSESGIEELEKLLEIQTKRFDVFCNQTIPAQLAELEDTVQQAEFLYNLRKAQFDSLNVRAGAKGILAPIGDPIELGQQVSAGQILARITNPSNLKARLQIPQSQARDVLIGLTVKIDTYNGIISGIVSRIEPTVVQGNVNIDVSLKGELPKGARPDLSVIGTIEIENIKDILYVGRPVQITSGSRTELFKVIENGQYAERIPVQFGKASVSNIEILDGLVAGDEIILSDTSPWDGVDRIRLK